MAEFRFSDLRAAARAIAKDSKARDKRMAIALKKAALNTRNYVVRETAPRAFGVLAQDIHLDESKPGQCDIRADAPYAAAVENGTRPHTPPLAPLIAWVTIRGVQGLSSAGRVKTNRTRYGVVRNPKQEAARVVASNLRNTLRGQLRTAGVDRKTAARAAGHAAAAWRGAATARLASGDPVEGADPATVAVARAIQAKIANVGTKPQKFMMKAIPEAHRALDAFVQQMLPDREVQD